MEALGISKLPPELLIHIFGNLVTFKNARALASSSRALRDVHISNAHAIYQNILAKTILCPDDAFALADAQIFARRNLCITPSCQFHGQSEELDEFKDPLLTPRQARVIANARAVRKACSYFLSKSVGEDITKGCISSRSGLVGGDAPRISPHRDPPFLTNSEIERFYHAYYRVWTYMTYEYVIGCGQGCEGKKRQRQLVDECDLVEHWRMCEIAYFLMVDCCTDLTIRPNLCKGSCAEDRSRHWNQGLGDIFNGYHYKLISVGHNGVIPRPSGAPRDFYIAVFDCHQETIRKMAQDIYDGKVRG